MTDDPGILGGGSPMPPDGDECELCGEKSEVLAYVLVHATARGSNKQVFIHRALYCPRCVDATKQFHMKKD